MIYLLYLISKILSWISASLMVLCVVLMSLNFFNLLPEDWNITFEFPIALDKIKEFYPIELDKNLYESIDIQITEASLELLPASNNDSWQLLGYLGAFIYTSLFFLIFLNLSKALANVKQKISFSRSNYRYIRNIGLTLIVMSTYEFLFTILVSHWHMETIESLNISNVSPAFDWSFNGSTMLSGFLLLVLAEVFKEGTELKELEEQTV